MLRDLVAPGDRPLAGFFDTIGVIGRSLAAPPGTSPEAVEALRSAFQAMVVDPAYVAEAKQSQLRVLPKSGEALEAAIADTFLKSDPDVLRRAQALTK